MMHHGFRLGWAAIIFGVAIRTLSAATLDHDAGTPGHNYDKALFRLWFPDDLAAVCGVLVMVPGSNSDGRGLVADSVWQNFARKYRLALVGCFFTDKPRETPSFIEEYADARNGSGQALVDALSAFANAINHSEVASVPLIMWGHSAGGQFNYEFSCWKPQRVNAFVVNKGGVYFTHLAPESTRRIPALFFIGENDLEYRKMSLHGIYAMNRRAHALWTLAVEPKAGHEVGNTRDLAIKFFEAVNSMRKQVQGAAPISELKEEAGWVGNLTSFAFRQGKMGNDEWSTWLPSESFANAWVAFARNATN